jgi:hypothetical protein
LHALERPGSRSPDWANVKRIVKRFGGGEAGFGAWAGIDQPIKKAA